MNKLTDYIDHAIIGLFALILSMVVYTLSSREPPKLRLKNTLLGGVIAAVLSFPTWQYIGQGNVMLMIPIVFTYTVTGQFIPEFLQSVIPKLVKKFLSKKTGEDLENDNH